MALIFGIPSRHPYSYRGYRTPHSYDLFNDLGGLMALSHDLIESPWFPEQQRQPNSPRTIRIAQIPLGHYRPEDISIAVEGDQVTAHGKHRLESENGFECSEFKKSFKLPGEVDPASVTSRGTRDGFLVIQGKERVVETEKQSDDSKFELKMDLRGFNPDDVEIKLHGKELKVSAKQTAEDEAGNWSRGYSMSRHIVLPDDVDPSSVSSKLSKEGLLSIEANRNPALVARERTVEISREAVEPGKEQDPEEAGIADKPQEN